MMANGKGLSSGEVDRTYVLSERPLVGDNGLLNARVTLLLA